MSAEEEVAKGKADETQAIAAEAQKDLDEALPALDAAQKVREGKKCKKAFVTILCKLYNSSPVSLFYAQFNILGI